jgi:hypothetical protein
MVTKKKQYVIVRSYDAGAFAGELKEHDRVTRHAVLANARRLWYWSGAASLSELSQKGVSNPNGCKFPAEVPEQLIANVIEVIPCTEAARESIAKVPLWTKH